MITIRRILCPLDFSRFSRHALEQAVAVAREFGAEIAALHVYTVAPIAQVVPAGAPMAIEPTHLSAADRAELVTEVRQFAADVDAEGVRIDVSTVDGEPATAIAAQAAAWGADLIVMGTHGRSGLERAVLGSVAENVIRRAPCPVLTVPPRVITATQDLTFSQILCAVDFSSASLRALEYAASLSAIGGPGIRVLHVVDLVAESRGIHGEPAFDAAGFHAEMKVAARARLNTVISDAVRARCPITEIVTMGKPDAEILRIAEEEACDLIVLGVHGRSGFDRLIFGSTAQRVVRQAACPVLTIRS